MHRICAFRLQEHIPVFDDQLFHCHLCQLTLVSLDVKAHAVLKRQPGLSPVCANDIAAFRENPIHAVSNNLECILLGFHVFLASRGVENWLLVVLIDQGDVEERASLCFAFNYQANQWSRGSRRKAYRLSDLLQVFMPWLLVPFQGVTDERFSKACG